MCGDIVNPWEKNIGTTFLSFSIGLKGAFLTTPKSTSLKELSIKVGHLLS
jgi:hypothetical protein